MPHTPVLIVVTLFVGAFALPIAGKWKSSWVSPIALLSAVTSLVLSSMLWLSVHRHGPTRYFVGGWKPPWGIEIYVDKLGATMVFVLMFVGACAMLYSLASAAKEIPQTGLNRYHALNLLLLGSLCGMVLSGDIFNMYVFMEIASLAACGTITAKGTIESVEASLRYFLLSEVGSGCVLLGIVILYMLTGQLNMEYIARSIPEAMASAPKNTAASLGLITLGFLIKAALFPLHIWLPDAHSVAPTPSSAILSGLVVKVAPFTVWRVIDRVYGQATVSTWWLFAVLTVLSLSGVVLGSLLSLGQSQIKRLLAYSTIGQVGYIFLGLGLAVFSPRTAVTGAFLQVFNHAFIKACLFLAAGQMYYTTGATRVSDLAGAGLRMPLTMGAFSVAALAMVGIPPLNGFFAKWYLAKAALEAGRPLYVGVLLAGSLIALLYCFPFIQFAYFSKSDTNEVFPKPKTFAERIRAEGSFGTLVPVLILAGACIVLGFFPQTIADLIR